MQNLSGKHCLVSAKILGMKPLIARPVKILLVITFIIGATIGFMIKLPATFRHIDKEMHAAFYFLAAGFLNVLFTDRKLPRHIIIVIALFLFGVAIEFAQEYSNTLFHVRIHGRYDIEDVKSNSKGLIAYSMLWCIYVSFVFVYRKASFKQTISDQG